MKKIKKQPHAPSYAFQNAEPCGAKTRKGTACKGPATAKGRCRLHGGATGSGAPYGNKNALKHGGYSLEHKLFSKKVSDILKSISLEGIE